MRGFADLDEGRFVERLLHHAGEAGVVLSETQAELCCRHARLMVEWNRRVNLTRITDLEGIVVSHFLDSLIPARWLPQEGFAVDVGTGPGFPGIPLKIIRPGLDMLLLEASARKVSFLKAVLAQLSLNNMWALQDRWESFADSSHPFAGRKYALATMRAVRMEPEIMTIFASRILRPGGVFSWWAGADVVPGGIVENSVLEGTGLSFEGSFRYDLPAMAKSRQFLLWKKEEGRGR